MPTPLPHPLLPEYPASGSTGLTGPSEAEPGQTSFLATGRETLRSAGFPAQTKRGGLDSRAFSQQLWLEVSSDPLLVLVLRLALFPLHGRTGPLKLDAREPTHLLHFSYRLLAGVTTLS